MAETHRTARGPRQRIVAYLGELTESEQSGFAQLAARLPWQASETQGNPSPKLVQRTLFDPPEKADVLESLSSTLVLVDLSGVRLERTVAFGEVWLAWGLWRLLGLDVWLREAIPGGQEKVPWHVAAANLVIARFCKPSSELHIETTWYRQTALEDLLDVPSEKVHTDRLYAGLDKLLPHKESLEKHLKDRLGRLFNLDYEILLYDVTSTYFEGQCRRNPQAKRGYSRDNRPDCLQVCIALVVTTDGMPVGYEVFAGNRTDCTTVEEIVNSVEKKQGRSNRIWVMDRGMVSEDNLAFLRRREGRYIVGTPKASLRKFEAELLKKDWEEVEEGVEVKLASSPDGEETFILARSRERREKDKAIRRRFVERMEVGLKKLEAAMESGRLHDEAEAHRRLGKLQGENARAAKAFDVKIESLTQEDAASDKASVKKGKQQGSRKDETSPTGASPKKSSNKSGAPSKAKKGPRLKITWSRNPTWGQWAELSEGCYLLRSNVNDLDAKTLWKHYIQLTDAEWAFRIAKDELVVRPIWHQREDRVQAHILVCFLAYALWKTLAGLMTKSGLGDAPRGLLDALSTLQAGDVVLPLHLNETDRRELRLRCVTSPDKEQKLLLNRLGLTLPRRLGSQLQPTKCSEDF
jgi:transposase